mmetsp:Transcript_10498/g.30902  ORF Transcript_10498/g.30902 Transcript_10498/m.30902 type:complete len:273 (-) Transcript_10498:122-940(-)
MARHVSLPTLSRRLQRISRHLLRLDESHPSRVPLVHDVELIVLLVPEDVKVVIDVIEGEDGLLEGDSFAQVVTLDLGDGRSLGIHELLLSRGRLALLGLGKAVENVGNVLANVGSPVPSVELPFLVPLELPSEAIRDGVDARVHVRTVLGATNDGALKGCHDLGAVGVLHLGVLIHDEMNVAILHGSARRQLPDGTLQLLVDVVGHGGRHIDVVPRDDDGDRGRGRCLILGGGHAEGGGCGSEGRRRAGDDGERRRGGRRGGQEKGEGESHG